MRAAGLWTRLAAVYPVVIAAKTMFALVHGKALIKVRGTTPCSAGAPTLRAAAAVTGDMPALTAGDAVALLAQR